MCICYFYISKIIHILIFKSPIIFFVVFFFSEIKYVQTKGTYPRDRVVYLNVYKDKPVKISAKVLVPVKEHPKVQLIFL